MIAATEPRSSRLLLQSLADLNRRPASRRDNPPAGRGPTVEQRLNSLRKYLSIIVDPYDFAYMIPDFYEYIGEDVPPSFAADDPSSFMTSADFPEVEDDFVEWLREYGIDSDVMSDPLSPAYLHFGDVYGIADKGGEWLVHFSDHARDIAEDGFVHGQPNEQLLGLTTLLDDSERFGEPGWDFAFLATGGDAAKAANERKYGRDAVLFKARGLHVRHDADEERQVIFWGPSASKFVLLSRQDRFGWSVSSRRTEEELCGGRFRDVVDCAITSAYGRGVAGPGGRARTKSRGVR